MSVVINCLGYVGIISYFQFMNYYYYWFELCGCTLFSEFLFKCLAII